MLKRNKKRYATLDVFMTNTIREKEAAYLTARRTTNLAVLFYFFNFHTLYVLDG